MEKYVVETCTKWLTKKEQREYEGLKGEERLQRAYLLCKSYWNDSINPIEFFSTYEEACKYAGDIHVVNALNGKMGLEYDLVWKLINADEDDESMDFLGIKFKGEVR